MTLADIMWNTMKKHYREIVENICNNYEIESKYRLKKIYEKDELVGFYCYYDTPDFRFLEFAAYTGKNRFIATKIWKAMTNTKNNIRLQVQTVNKRMFEFYAKRGFVVIAGDDNNTIMERGTSWHQR